MFRECDSGHSFLIHAVSRPVAKTLCLGPAPSASQLCNIPCSTDCIMSSWSAWGLCVHENCRDPQGRKGECLVYMCFNSSVHTDLFWLLKSSLSLLRTIFVYKMQISSSDSIQLLSRHWGYFFGAQYSTLVDLLIRLIVDKVIIMQK